MFTDAPLCECKAEKFGTNFEDNFVLYKIVVNKKSITKIVMLFYCMYTINFTIFAEKVNRIYQLMSNFTQKSA